MHHITHSRVLTSRDHTSGECDSGCPWLHWQELFTRCWHTPEWLILTLFANYNLSNSGSPAHFGPLSQSASTPNQSEQSKTQHNSDMRPPNSDMRQAVTTPFSAKFPHNNCSYRSVTLRMGRNQVRFLLNTKRMSKIRPEMVKLEGERDVRNTADKWAPVRTNLQLSELTLSHRWTTAHFTEKSAQNLVQSHEISGEGVLNYMFDWISNFIFTYWGYKSRDRTTLSAELSELRCQK